jgi:hypothetical protein
MFSNYSWTFFHRKARSRILLINGSSRSDQSCTGEMSKTFRLVTIAKEVIAKARGEGI